MPIALPTTVNVPPERLHDFSILLGAPKKWGKTSLAACFPNALVLEGEPGNAKALPIRQLDITKWEEFIQVLDLLAKNPNYCDTKIMDDVPSFYNMCMDYCGQKHGFEHPSDQGYGKGWKLVDAEFQKRLKQLQSLRGGTVYTAHTAIKEIENRHGKKFNKLETSMTGQADRCMDALVQIWCCGEYDKNDNRILTIRGSDYVKAGCGLPNKFMYTDGTEVMSIPMGKSAMEGYKNLILAFENKLENPNAPKPKGLSLGVKK